jgi:hypothetical protein
VVQQRAGVSLKGGVGEEGDPYERHADAVADAVVSGRSAEALLDQTPGSGSVSASASQAIQRKEGDVPEVPADAPVEGEKSEGDKLREAILAGAEKRLNEKTTIVSQEKIDEIRNKPASEGGMKNFTTCIEFAGQTMGDGARAVGGSPKAAQKIAMLLPTFMLNFQKQTGVSGQIAAFEKAAARWDKPIEDAELKVATLTTEIEQLEAQGQTGDKSTDIRNKALISAKKQQRKAYESQLTIFHREQDKMIARVEKLGGELGALQEKTEAMIRPEPGMTNGRPKPGEYIILGAASAQSYGVNDATKVTLAKGSFKHIAVFHDCKKAPSPTNNPDEEWEEWHTIDGGGTTAKATTMYVRMSDGAMQYQTPGTAWAQSSSAVLGWIDMNILVSQGLGT